MNTTPRDKYGHMIQWPGSICYQDGQWRLIYVGSANVDGSHEFWVEQVHPRIRLGRMSFEQAKAVLADLMEHDRLPA